MERRFITARTSKTGETVSIPILPMLWEVLEPLQRAPAKAAGAGRRAWLPQAASPVFDPVGGPLQHARHGASGIPRHAVSFFGSKLDSIPVAMPGPSPARRGPQDTFKPGILRAPAAGRFGLTLRRTSGAAGKSAKEPRVLGYCPPDLAGETVADLATALARNAKSENTSMATEP